MAKSDQRHRGRWVKGKSFDCGLLRRDVQLKMFMPDGLLVPVSYDDAVVLVGSHEAEVLSAWTIARLTDGKRWRS